MIPAWEADAAKPVKMARDANAVAQLGSLLVAPHRVWDHVWSTRAGNRIGIMAAIAYLLYAYLHLFPMSFDLKDGLFGALAQPGSVTIENKADSDFVKWLISVTINERSVAYMYMCVGLSAIGYVIPRGGLLRLTITRTIWCLVLCVASLIWLGITLLPLQSITNAPVAPLLPSWGGLRDASTHIYEMLEPLHVSSSYGLFRRMTGVGYSSTGKGVGWGGQKPSIVAVPAIAVEAEISNNKWIEVPFRYAPFVEGRAPRRTAPHHPRLDWQMWFAALGSYQHNPWFVHLLYKLLLGGDQNDALNLLDEIPNQLRSRPPRRVRATLYHYDFTRLSSPWSKGIPGAKILAQNCSFLGPYIAPEGSTCGAWWTRRTVRQYMPPVSLDDLSPLAVAQGWPTDAGSLSSVCGEEFPAKFAGCSRQGGGGHICAMVVAVHCVAEPLRQFLGFEARIARRLFFFDGPMLVILFFLALCTCVRVLLSMGVPREGDGGDDEEEGLEAERASLLGREGGRSDE